MQYFLLYVSLSPASFMVLCSPFFLPDALRLLVEVWGDYIYIYIGQGEFTLVFDYQSYANYWHPIRQK